MGLFDSALHILAWMTRKLPFSRRLGRFYRPFARAMVRLGAKPLVRAKMRDGTTLLVDLSTHTQLDSFFLGTYDSRFIKAICALLEPSDCLLDLGANIGFYTVAIANYQRQTGATGRIVAFEPLPGNFVRLSENISLNGLDSRCTAFNYGLSDAATEGLITLREDFARGSSTGNASIPTSESFDQGFARVPIALKRLDDVWPEAGVGLGRIGVIKMDIEGHEDCCLQGGQATIHEHRPCIFMEVNKPYYTARNVEIDSRFWPLIPPGYGVFRPEQERWVPLTSFDQCRKVDNVFLIPDEKRSKFSSVSA